MIESTGIMYIQCLHAWQQHSCHTAHLYQMSTAHFATSLRCKLATYACTVHNAQQCQPGHGQPGVKHVLIQTQGKRPNHAVDPTCRATPPCVDAVSSQVYTKYDNFLCYVHAQMVGSSGPRWHHPYHCPRMHQHHCCPGADAMWQPKMAAALPDCHNVPQLDF